MAFTIRNQYSIAAFLLVTLFAQTFGHSYVTSPQSRSNQAQSNIGCRGPNCLGPCDVPLAMRTSSSAVHSASRGESISIQWPRNNHAGGFIRFAWAPTSQSDNATYFDNHVQQINCHEVGGCYPDDPSNPNGGDSGPANGSSRACTSNFTVPADLADGQWTLQWAWFGGAFSLGDYYSCVDYSISGGNSGPTPVPVFVGGDYSYPNQQKCKFFNTDRLHVCVNEPCSNPIYPAAQQQSGPPAYVQANFVVNSTASTSASVPATTAAAPSTTAAAAPATTAAAAPSTTAAAAPSTTGAAKPSTTGAAMQQPSTTGATLPSTTGAASVPSTTAASSGSCVSGHMKCLTANTYSMCSWGSWGASQSCAPSTYCSNSGDYIYCLANSTPSTPAAPVPSTSTSTSSSSSSCTPGYQKCSTSSSYQTCVGGLNGNNYWSATQSCQTGLQCHPSSTANNIYCY